MKKRITIVAAAAIILSMVSGAVTAAEKMTAASEANIFFIDDLLVCQNIYHYISI